MRLEMRSAFLHILGKLIVAAVIYRPKLTAIGTDSKCFHHWCLHPRELERHYSRLLADAFNATVLREMPLWVPHPENQKLCVRYHEPWPKSRTKFDATEVRMNNAPEDLGKKIDAALYDSRVCNYLQFGENEIIVSDNILMMHTREAYPPGSPRRFWRIHVN